MEEKEITKEEAHYQAIKGLFERDPNMIGSPALAGASKEECERYRKEKNVLIVNKILEEEQDTICMSSIEDENRTLHIAMADALALRKRPELLSNAKEQLAKAIERRIKVYTWADDSKKEMWVYSNGVYTTNGKCILQKELRQILGELYDDALVNDIIKRIEVDTYISQKEFISRALDHEYEINVSNGVIEIDPKTFETKLLPHNKNNIFLWKLNIPYNPKAKCPAIDKFLEETLADPNDRYALEEALGTTLQPHLITKKAVISYGEPDTGKSTTTNLIHAFLGENNCCNLTLQQITEKDFLLSNLFGKIANIAGDLSQEVVKNIEQFKSLTGGDPQEGDRKYKETVKFNNQAKLFFNMNKLPGIYNADLATWNRMMPFKYVRVFVDEITYNSLPDGEKGKYGIKDINIIKKLTAEEELSGLLNKAIAGLMRFLKNWKFSYARGVEEVSKEWIRLSDSFMAFCMDNITQGDPSEDYITRRDLASAYNKYIKKHGVKGVGDKSMKATLSGEYGVYVDGFTTVPGSNERCWEGIKWKHEKYGGTLK